MLPIIAGMLDRHYQTQTDRRVFEVGCGTGVSANWLRDYGFDVTGVDPSPTGIALAHEHFPELKLHPGSAYDDLAAQYGQFPCVLAMEVIEHVYDPRLFVSRLFDLVLPGGIVIVTTPFHGYWKNLALALTGRMDSHFTALWEHGHIKFWSPDTLSTLLSETGFAAIRIHRVGRIPALARSMIACAKRPASMT